MSYTRLSPPYRVFELRHDGSRRRLALRDIVVELAPGVEIELNFAPHPNFAGKLVMYTPARANMKAAYDAGVVDDFAVVFGATNVLHVSVEQRTRPRGGGRTTRKRGGRG